MAGGRFVMHWGRRACQMMHRRVVFAGDGEVAPCIESIQDDGGDDSSSAHGLENYISDWVLCGFVCPLGELELHFLIPSANSAYCPQSMVCSCCSRYFAGTESFFALAN